MPDPEAQARYAAQDMPGEWHEFRDAEGRRARILSVPRQNERWPGLEDGMYVEVAQSPREARPLVWGCATRADLRRHQLVVTKRAETWALAVEYAEAYARDALAFLDGPAPDWPSIGRAWEGP